MCMARYEATFEIISKTHAHIVRRLMEQVYDTLREELRAPARDESSPNDTLQQFKAIREATRHLSPATLTVIYEQHDDTFDD